VTVLDLLAEIRDLTPDMRPEVVIISATAPSTAAVKATKLGAYDFLEKPLSLERTLIVLKNAVEARRLRTQNEEFKRQFSAAAALTGESVPLKAFASKSSSWPPPMAACSSTASQAPARSLSRVPSMLKASAATESLSSSTAPRFLKRISRPSSSLSPRRATGRPSEQRGTLERADGGTLYLDESGRHEPQNASQSSQRPR